MEKTIAPAEAPGSGRIPQRGRPSKHQPSITIGTDLEVEVWRNGSHNSLGTYNPAGWRGYGPLGLDDNGRTLELRPQASTTAAGLAHNTAELMHRVMEAGFRVNLAGHHEALGLHIHFGFDGRSDWGGTWYRWLHDDGRSLVELLDDFIGRYAVVLSGRARGHYAHCGTWEEKPYGFEYRPCAAALAHNPRIFRIVFKLALNLVKRYFRSFELKYEDNLNVADLVRVGRLTNKEAVYYMAWLSDMRERVSSGEVFAAWGRPHITPPPPPRVNVTFSDDWSDIVRCNIAAALEGLEVAETVNIRLYGYASDRGQTTNFAALASAASWTWVDRSVHASADDMRELRVGLPYGLRNYWMEYDADRDMVINHLRVLITAQ